MIIEILPDSLGMQNTEIFTGLLDKQITELTLQNYENLNPNQQVFDCK